MNMNLRALSFFEERLNYVAALGNKNTNTFVQEPFRLKLLVFSLTTDGLGHFSFLVFLSLSIQLIYFYFYFLIFNFFKTEFFFHIYFYKIIMIIYP